MKPIRAPHDAFIMVVKSDGVDTRRGPDLPPAAGMLMVQLGRLMSGFGSARFGDCARLLEHIIAGLKTRGVLCDCARCRADDAGDIELYQQFCAACNDQPATPAEPSRRVH